MDNSNNKKGNLYLIPSDLGDHNTIDLTIPEKVKEIIQNLNEFIVEDERSARRYLKNFNLFTPIQNIQFHLLNEHTKKDSIINLLKSLLDGKNTGLMSEAGCPAVADPGAALIHLAHQNNIKVIPLVGPSSILLALMASGMNGQSFAFSGYLPVDKHLRKNKIKELEKKSFNFNETQIFIETPYRNQQLLSDILYVCNENSELCIASDITLEAESILTKTIHEWKKHIPDIHKKPAIFLLYRGK